MVLQEYIGTIKEIQEISTDCKHFKIELDKELDFKAGQFTNLTVEDEGESYTRPYSIASSPKNKKEIEFCIKLVKTGKVTPHIFHKKEDDKMTLKGPFGLFTTDKLQKEKVVLIGTGTGIAPLRSIAKDLIEKESPKQITLIYGIRFENQIPYKEEFEKLEQDNPNFKYVQVISKPTENWEGRTGHVQDNLDTIDSQNSEIYMCGLTNMVDAVKEKLNQMGITDEFIHFEKY
jgi:NAD(P)H-flavin reductase